MSDILYDARLWLEGRPRRTRTHWDDCHLASGHTECLVRKLLDEIELLRGYRDEAEADAAVARLLVDRSRLTETEMDAMNTAIDTLHAVQDRTKDHEAKPAIAAARLMRLLDRLKTIVSGDSDRTKAIKNQRRADYNRWLRTPYCEGHGCQCNGGRE